MGKLVNPFASHAKDPQFEPGWNHFCQVLADLTSNACGYLFMYLRIPNLSSESIMWLAFVGKLVNPFA